MRNFLANSVGWLPWVGVIVVAAIIGGTLGLTGVLGHPTTPRAVYANDASLARTAAALRCPAGREIARLQAGDRVVAVARSADNAYLGVRNPLNIGQTIWVRSGIVTLDKDQPAISTLPVQECIVATAIPKTVTATPPVIVSPTKPVKPVTPPAPDKTAPTLGTPTAGTPVVCTRNGSGPYTDTITVTATDNVGVTAVAISWSGAASGSGSMTRGTGSTWTYVYDVGSSLAGGTVTFQVQARDAAGNLSSPTKVSITQTGCLN